MYWFPLEEIPGIKLALKQKPKEKYVLILSLRFSYPFEKRGGWRSLSQRRISLPLVNNLALVQVSKILKVLDTKWD
jgi:hypothetical protein